MSSMLQSPSDEIGVTAKCVIVRSIGRPFDSGPNVMTSSLIPERPGVAGKGIRIFASLPAVAARRYSYLVQTNSTQPVACPFATFAV